MTQTSIFTVNATWQPWEKHAFRFLFLFFLIGLLPIDGPFIHQILHIHWLHIGYEDIFELTKYKPWFTSLWDGYGNFLILAVIAFIGTFIWLYIDKDGTTNYEWLHKWLRILLRYRVAIALLGYGMLKLFPLQAPFPTISNLNTPYGDFSRWKLFSMSLGIVPGYQTFLGLVEILAALLLLNRKTTTIGAGIILFFTGNVFMSNIAYENGEGYYSLYLILMTLFLLSFDARRIWNLIFQQKIAVPKDDLLVLRADWQGKARLLLKSLVFIFFIIIYGFKTYAGYKSSDYYQLPRTKGIEGSAGIYHIPVFQINGHDIPYSETDSSRWQDVVFEKWSTISVKTNKELRLDSSKGEAVGRLKDLDRDYELSGSGGRAYYSYVVDTVRSVLLLQNKNPHYSRKIWELHYRRPNAEDWVLNGVNENGDSIYTELHKMNKKYLLEAVADRGRGKRIKL